MSARHAARCEHGDRCSGECSTVTNHFRHPEYLGAHYPLVRHAVNKMIAGIERELAQVAG